MDRRAVAEGFMGAKLLEMDTNVGNNLDYVSYEDLNEVPVYTPKNRFYGRINPKRGRLEGMQMRDTRLQVDKSLLRVVLHTDRHI